MVNIEELTRVADWLRRGQIVWDEYQRAHDVDGRRDQTVGVDPDTGFVMFGASRAAVAERMTSEGYSGQIWYTWVGESTVRRHTGMRRV